MGFTQSGGQRRVMEADIRELLPRCRASITGVGFDRPGGLDDRNVVLGRLRPSSDPTQAVAESARLAAGREAIAGLGFPGLLSMQIGRDLVLRKGGWSFAITNEWVDVAFYRTYDTDTDHLRLRREVIAPICADIARVQFTVPD